MSANETADAEPQPVATETATPPEAAAETTGGSAAGEGATATASAASTTPTAPPAAATAAMDPSAAVNAAMMAERVIRRASLTAGGGGGMMGMGMGNVNMNNVGLLNPGGAGMAMGPMYPADDSSLFERAMALQSEQHKNTMALARASLGLDPYDPRASLGLGTLTPRGSLALGAMDTRRASLGMGTMGRRSSLGFDTMPARPSLGLGTMPARPSLGLGTLPGAPGAAAPGAWPDANPNATTAGYVDGQADQQALLRLARIRTARAEVEAAQARLAELETHTALAARGQGSKETAATTRANPAATGAAAGAAAGSDDNSGGAEGEGGDKADARDLEAAETFLSMSGKKQQDQILPGDGAVAADSNAADANANANPMMQQALGMAPGAMLPGMAAHHMNMLPAMPMGFPRRVSMDLFAQNADPALLAEVMMAERRLSSAAGAAANFAVAHERRSTLPMISGNGIQPGAMGNNYPIAKGVPVPTTAQTGSAGTKNSRSRPADAPRRPLSAYNFFFIDERERILKAMKERDAKKAAEKAENEERDKDGNESKNEEERKDDENGEKQEEDPLKDVDLDDSDFSPSTYDELMTLRLNNKEKPRPHRKTHGQIGFQTLAKLIAKRWKALGEDRRDHYKSLAVIDMDKYKEKTMEYQNKKMKNSAGEAVPTGKS